MTEIIKFEFYVPLRETCYRNGLLSPERALHYSRASFLVLEASLQVHRQLRIDLTAYRWDLGYQEEYTMFIVEYHIGGRILSRVPRRQHRS